MPDEKDISRRRFLQYTGLVTGAAAALGLSTVSMAAEQGGNAHSGHAAATANPLNRARMFFTNELDFSTLSEAAERIFPKDEFGPGAKELAVPYFIDNQLTATTRGNTSPGLISRALPPRAIRRRLCAVISSSRAFWR